MILIISLFFVLVFPTENSFQQLMAYTVFLFFLPFLFIRWVLGERLREYGWRLDHPLRGILWATAGVLVLSLLFSGIFRYTGYFDTLSIPSSTRSNFFLFLMYMFLLGGYLFLFEFFFRGFTLFLWQKKTGYWSVIIQALLFSGLVFAKSAERQVSAILFLILIISVLSGSIAYRTQSIAYSFFFSYLSAILGVSVAIIFF